MTALAFALRPSRIRRFFSLIREVGLRNALARARTELRLLRAGQVPGSLDSAGVGASGPQRFAFAPLWRDLARKNAFHLGQAPALLSRHRSVAMIGDLNLPQCRKYRVEQMGELWGLAGVEYRFAHYEDLPRCRDILQDSTHLMLYRLGRSDLATMYLYEARRLRLPIAYDLDDPLFSVSAYETYGNMGAVPPDLKRHFVNEAPLYLDVLNAADLLSFSTPALCAHAATYSNRPVMLRRNFADRATLDAGDAAVRPGQPKPRFTVAVASGSAGHDADLAEIREDLIGFLGAAPDRQLLVLGQLDVSGFPEELHRQILRRPFSGYSAYLAALATAHCAVMPLAPDLFNGCKSAVRVIDAAAVSVPALVSDIGDLPQAFIPEVTGRVVTGRSGWRDALEDLAQDPDHTLKMGKEARRYLTDSLSARLDLPVVDPAFIDWVRG